MHSNIKRYRLFMYCLIVPALLMPLLLIYGLQSGAFQAFRGPIIILLGLAEGFCVSLMIYFACKARQLSQLLSNAPSASGRIFAAARENGVWLVFGTIFLLTGGICLGYFFAHAAPALYRRIGRVALPVFLCLTVLQLALSLLLAHRHRRKWETIPIREGQQFLLAHRDQAEKTAAAKLRLLRRLRHGKNAGAGLLGAMGLGITLFFSHTLPPFFAIVAMGWAGWVLLAALAQIHLGGRHDDPHQWKTLLPDRDFPLLYEMAREAKAEMGCQSEVCLLATSGNTAEIMPVGRLLVVTLGADLLNTLCQEEMYAILLHEFAHLAPRNRAVNHERLCAERILSPQSGSIRAFSNLFFRYTLCRYAWEYQLFLYASSLDLESQADQAMKSHAHAAASSLLKLACRDLYEWELAGRDHPSGFAAPTLTEEFLLADQGRFQEALLTRKEDWKRMIEGEILSNSASHPTCIMRVRALGFVAPPALLPGPTGIYADECLGAFHLLYRLLSRQNSNSYAETRQRAYLGPLARVRAWREAGMPVIDQEYGDRIDDLLTLGEVSQTLDLCQRAIDTLPPCAAATAHFIRGSLRLHAWDAGGLSDLYTAMEENANHIEEALDLIGTFCCLMGLQTELETYRERAPRFQEEERTHAAEVVTLKRRDRLSQEHLPSELMENLLSFLASLPAETLENVYLVRKTISDQRFTSALILDFDINARDETIRDLSHRVFAFLDTTTSWQFSLFHLTDLSGPLVEKIRKVPGSLIYSRDQSPR